MIAANRYRNLRAWSAAIYTLETVLFILFVLSFCQLTFQAGVAGNIYGSV